MDVKLTFRKEGGKLVFTGMIQENIYKMFRNDLPEGASVDAFFSMRGPKGTLAQLAKLHKTIREVAGHTGYSFDEVKLLTKKKAGLILEHPDNPDCESFGECSYDELSLAINAAQELGMQVGIAAI